MKTKLLKKIRKQYSIVYYPNGNLHNGYVYDKGKYKVLGLYKKLPIWYLNGHDTRQDALDMLMDHIRSKYCIYSVKNKSHYKGIKVWYNQPPNRNLTIDTDGDGYSY